MNQSELEANTCNRRQTRENASEQVTIGLSFTSDWSRKWRQFFWPITERIKAKPKKNENYALQKVTYQMVKYWGETDEKKLGKILKMSFSVFFFHFVSGSFEGVLLEANTYLFGIFSGKF